MILYDAIRGKQHLWQNQAGEIQMPFNSSYQDDEKLRYLNARERFRSLANVIVRDPLSTHIIQTSTLDNKTHFLVVDRAQIPGEGDMAVVATSDGLRFGKITKAAPSKNLWGKITWVVQEI